MLEESTGNFSAARNIYDWYQNNTHVILNVMIKNLKECDVKVRLIDETLDVSCNLADGSEFKLHFNLFKPIIVTESSWSVTPSKLEIKLKKTDRKRWQSLETLPEKGSKKPVAVAGVVLNRRNQLETDQAVDGVSQLAESSNQSAECSNQSGEADSPLVDDENALIEEEDALDDGESLTETSNQQQQQEHSNVQEELSQSTNGAQAAGTSTESVAQNSPAGAKCNQKNWDKIVREFEEEEKTSADGSVDELFREIYEKGGEEVRKAMNKSFIESKGTVLSTNWDQVKSEKTELKPPEGTEFKAYE